MKPALLLVPMILITMWPAVAAPDIGSPESLRPSSIILERGWTGWKYSLNSGGYQSVGISASPLYAEMTGHPQALAELDQYRSQMTAATVMAVGGAALVAFPLASAIVDSEWSSTYTVPVVAGGFLMGMSKVLSAAAGRHLESGVRLYNAASADLRLGLAVDVRSSGGTPSSRIVLVRAAL